MSFIPVSDFKYPARRFCGWEGSAAAAGVRDEVKFIAKHGSDVPSYIAKDNAYRKAVHAETFAASRTWLKGVADKPTWDYPSGGKLARPFHPTSVTPSPITSIVNITQLSGSSKRMNVVEWTPERERALWFPGHLEARVAAASVMANCESVVPPAHPL